MRIGISIDAAAADAVAMAAAADEAGLAFVLVRDRDGLAAVSAGPVAVATTDARIVVEVAIGDENPVTLAEELVVLDAASGGRLAALASTGALDVAAAAEDVALLRLALTPRPFRHRGPRWSIPAGIAPEAGETIMVTPPTVQFQFPLWVEGAAAAAVARDLGIPELLPTGARPTGDGPLVPATAALTGDRAIDLALVAERSRSGVTHLAVSLPPDAPLSALPDYVARHLIPEVAMVGFPRLLAEDEVPPAWPGA